MQDPGWTLLIASHAIAASLAMIFGAINLIRRRRGDRPHRLIGRIWAGLMYFTAIGSFGIQEPRPGDFSWIHGLSALTIVTLSLALWHVRRGNVKAHAANMIGTYCGLIGAFIGVIAVPTRRVPLAFQQDWFGMIQISGIIILAGLAAVFVITRLLPDEVDNAPQTTGDPPPASAPTAD